MSENRLIYSFDPVYDPQSRLLILGTMASPASIKSGFYYGHPQNAFWRILSDLTGELAGVSKIEKTAFLHRHGIALWDTLSCCERNGALDSNIKSEIPNNVASLLIKSPSIEAVYLNGGAAFYYYKKYHSSIISLPFFKLPSSSPANARSSYETKLEKCRIFSYQLI